MQQRGGHQPRLHRQLRAADQCPFDWIVPFIPPVLRVNRETRARWLAWLSNATTPEAIQQTLSSSLKWVRIHAKTMTLYAVSISVWWYGWTWVHEHAYEFAGAYVILSGFLILAYHLFYNNDQTLIENGMSAYSVFNKGGLRMLGSLSAQQFENEIRHRRPEEEDENQQHNASHQEEDEELDEEMLAALRLSLQEKKREDRKARRTTRRR